MKALSLWESLKIDLTAGLWDPYSNSGFTTEGGGNSLHFLLHKRLLFNLLPAPASVAWFMVLHLFFGGVGTYCYCRLIGASRPAHRAALRINSVTLEFSPRQRDSTSICGR